MDLTDLPDELAALATQLADDAAMLEATFPGAPPAAFAEEAREAVASLVAGERVSRDRVLRTAWSWTRVAALLAIAAGGTATAIWQWPSHQGSSRSARIAPVTSNVATVDVATADMAGLRSADAETIVAPTVISLEVAEGLSGEKIEVLADAFAAAAVEI